MIEEKLLRLFVQYQNTTKPSAQQTYLSIYLSSTRLSFFWFLKCKLFLETQGLDLFSKLEVGQAWKSFG
jgi:hypothetical protein